jgi:hypothetical protein
MLNFKTLKSIKDEKWSINIYKSDIWSHLTLIKDQMKLKIILMNKKMTFYY